MPQPSAGSDLTPRNMEERQERGEGEIEENRRSLSLVMYLYRYFHISMRTHVTADCYEHYKS